MFVRGRAWFREAEVLAEAVEGLDEDCAALAGRGEVVFCAEAGGVANVDVLEGGGRVAADGRQLFDYCWSRLGVRGPAAGLLPVLDLLVGCHGAFEV